MSREEYGRLEPGLERVEGGAEGDGDGKVTAECQPGLYSCDCLQSKSVLIEDIEDEAHTFVSASRVSDAISAVRTVCASPAPMLPNASKP